MERPRIGERLLLVVDRKAARDVAAALVQVPPGSALVQLRDKTASGRDLCEAARALREVARANGARLLVNDRVDVALAVFADGVHLPEDGLPVAEARALLSPSRLVGASTHGVREALEKARAGADLIVVGPIWETPSKVAYGPPLGLEALAQAVRAVRAEAPRTAVFAIGGIDSPARAREAVEAGADGVAVVRAMMSAGALYAALSR